MEQYAKLMALLEATKAGFEKLYGEKKVKASAPLRKALKELIDEAKAERKAAATFKTNTKAERKAAKAAV